MSSGRFQSQTFNWLNQQRIHWNDRLEQGWRSFQVGMTWGLQIALYPFYAAIQSSRLLLRSWQSSSQSISQPIPQPISQSISRPPGTSDSASLPCIEVPPLLSIAVAEDCSTQRPVDFLYRFLESVRENFGFKVRSSSKTDSKIETLPTLRGIACLCVPSQTQASRSLVWVDDRNQLWTIPPAQQQTLQYQMLNFLIQHTPQGDRFRVSLGSAPLKILPDRSQQLPAVRWFRRLLNWMHTSPIALSTNLFQEAYLSDLPSPPFPNPLPVPLQKDLQRFSLEKGDALIRFLDYHLAQLEPRPEPRPEPIPQESQKESQIMLVRANSSAPFAKPIKIPPFQTLSHNLSPLLEEVRAFQVGCTEFAQEIAAGLSLLTDHFQKKVLKPWFKPGAIVMTRKQPDPKLVVQPSLRTIPELFPNDLPEINLSQPNLSQINLSQPDSITDRTDVSLNTSSSHPLGREPDIKPLLPETILSETIAPQESFPISPAMPRNPSVSASSEQEIEPVKETIAVSSNPDPCPEIEVKSLTIAYVKHPLEHLLHWLDRLMTWLENQLARLWRAQ